jgi:hypothetical protein
MYGAILTLLHKPSWHGASLSMGLSLPLCPLLDKRNYWPFVKGIDHFLWNSMATEEFQNVWGVVNFSMQKQMIIKVHKHN